MSSHEEFLLYTAKRPYLQMVRGYTSHESTFVRICINIERIDINRRNNEKSKRLCTTQPTPPIPKSCDRIGPHGLG